MSGPRPGAGRVVIVGGGAVGAAVAYFLVSEPTFRGSVTILEPDPSYRYAATARSAGSIRQQFSTPLNIAMSAFGMQFLREAGARLGSAQEPVDVGLVPSTYLQLATAAGEAALDAAVRGQRRCGVRVRRHDRAGLAAAYPWLNTTDLVAGADTTEGEGWFDGYALLMALRRAGERGGALYRRERAIGFERSPDGGLAAVRLATGAALTCESCVLAAGLGVPALLAALGVDLPVTARKRTVFVFSCATPIPACPLVVDPGGLWFRAERDRFLCGAPLASDPDADPADFTVDEREFAERAWPALAHRVPAFESVRAVSSWAGHYDYNRFDQNAFVGRCPGIARLLLATGFSGHGLQHAVAIGRALAELLVHGGYRTLDLGPLSPERYERGEPLRELNVI
jgi:FAD-dependent oxidoreductase domain-containing protein 1